MTDTSSMAGQSSKVVVTLFESYGSGASYVSEKVAQALGIPYTRRRSHRRRSRTP